MPVICRPDVRELSLRLFDRVVHPEFFDGLHVVEIERDGYRVRVTMTPAGHALQWVRGKDGVCEVLGLQEDPMPEGGELFHHRLGGERTEAFTIHDRVRYECAFQIERVSADVFLRLQEEILTDAEESGVFISLNPFDRLGLSPLGYVDLQARPGSMIAHCRHTYPEDYAIIRSQTLIEFPN
jgi:hypothetical protein